MFGKRKSLNEELPEQVTRRAKMIPTPDLLGWAENAMYDAHRNLSSFRARTDAPEAPMYFAETKQSVEALLAVLREIQDRTGMDNSLANKPKPPIAWIETVRQQ